MKRNAIVRIVLYSLLVLVLTGVLLSGLLTNFVIDISSGTETVVDYEASLDAAPARSIQINWASGNVVVKAEDVDRIIIRETADDPIKDPMTYRYEDGSLEINHSGRKVYGPFYKVQEKNLVVIVPMNWVCQELDLDGAGLEVTISNLSVDEFSVDGAGVVLSFTGSVNEMEIDGAGCEVTMVCKDRPQQISLDGAGCVLSLTLPANCGFQMECDGARIEVNSDLPMTRENGSYYSGDRYCKISINGLGCEVTIHEDSTHNTTYNVRCGDDFTAGLLLASPDAQYTPGTIVKLQTDILTDVDLELYVNGKYICKQTELSSSDGTDYWVFYFTMPDENAVIHFKTVDGIQR